MGYDIEKEKREAIEAGRRALNSLQTAKENLNSAKNWGLADMFGGGFFTTMLKHSKMDQAKRNMEQAKYDLRNFSRKRMGYDIEKEKREAIEAGRRALNSLQTAKENLNSAKNWGLADMFGGGFFTTMLKHSKMDQAKRNMEQAKYDLRNFSRELNDVNMVCNLNIDTGDFLSFADYFFDGFVVDWVVQDRINNAKRQVEEAIRRTESIVNQLQRM